MALAESSGPLHQPAKVHAGFRGLALVTVLSAFALVVLGGVVRVSGSGLGCPDWPLCQGGFFPPLEREAVIEYSHRLVASALLGPLVVATCVVAWAFYRREGWLMVPATGALVLMLAQALLGGATVLNQLSGATVAAHLALGEALLGCLVLVLVVALRGPLALTPGPPSTGKADPFPALVLASGLGIYVVLMTGSYVTVAGASGACLDWPLCQGQLFPGHRLPMVHMAHRIAAATAGAILASTLYTGLRGGSRPHHVRALTLVAAALFAGQVLLGAVTVWLKFPAELRALHLSLATLLWTTMIALGALNFTRPGLPLKAAARA